MAKFFTAFVLTVAFLWLGADVDAGQAFPHVPLHKRIGPIVLEKNVGVLKVPANNCIVSGGEPGQILEQHVLHCTNRRNWLNINFVDREGAP